MQCFVDDACQALKDDLQHLFKHSSTVAIATCTPPVNRT